MNNPVFVNLVRCNAVQRYLCVEGELNKDYKFGPDYTYIEVPLLRSSKKHCEPGDVVSLKPAVKLNPKKCKLIFSLNPKLSSCAFVSGPTIIEPGEGENFAFTAQFFKKFEIEDLEWLCRVYAIY